MVGWQVLSRPSAAEGGGRRTAFTGPAIQPYSATEVDGWQHELSRVSQNRAAVHGKLRAIKQPLTLAIQIAEVIRLKPIGENTKEKVARQPPRWKPA